MPMLSQQQQQQQQQYMSMGSVHMQQPLFAHTAPFYSEDDGGVAISAAISGAVQGDLWVYMGVYGDSMCIV